MTKLVREMRPDKRGIPRAKWVRPTGTVPPSHENKVRRSVYHEIRLKAMNSIGDKCKDCGFSDMRALQIDHVNGDGNLDRQKYKGTSYYYFILRDDPKKYQILCANCNNIKRHEQEECRQSKWIV